MPKLISVNPKLTKAMLKPVGIKVHQEPVNKAMSLLAQYKFVPHVTLLTSPSPKNSKPTCAPIAYIDAPIKEDARSESILGIISIMIILIFVSPLTIAADTKSLFLYVIIWDLITLAFHAQPVRTSTPIKVPGPGGNQLAKITISGSPGITKNILIKKERRSSVLPPK